LGNRNFEVFTAVTMKKAVFWDVAPQSVAPALAGSLADFFLSSTLKMEAIRSSETSETLIFTNKSHEESRRN
jgi:hypothetical protein